jgi:Fic family protein
MAYAEKLDQIKKLKGLADGHGPLSEDVLKKINYKLRLEWNYTSNSMEGNSLTKSETRSVMIGNITVAGKPIKDVLEMKGHDEVVNTIMKMGRGELTISENRVKEIHKGIMHEEDPEKKKLIGVWKMEPNYLYNYKNERFDFTAPADVPEAMHKLVDWVNTERGKIERAEKDRLHPITLALKFHLDYVTIHPFYNGNGRTSRILTNLLLIAYGYPPLYIKENERGAYYQYLADIQGYGGLPDVFYEYMADLVIRSQQLVLDAIEGKDIEESDDYLKEIELIKAKISSAKPKHSPKLAYESFTYYDKHIWPAIEASLKQFDKLFSESKIFHTVNSYQKEKYETTSFLSNLRMERSLAPEEKKIFGHNIYEEEIRSVEWQVVKYGLKGTKYGRDYTVILKLELNNSNYKLYLKVKARDAFATEVFSTTAHYDEVLAMDDLGAVKSILLKHIVDEIKKDIEEEL